MTRPAPSSLMLEIDRVSKAYDQQPALHAVSLELAEGELLALLGPSGCGKTTLLRIIGGLEVADEGSIRLRGMPINNVPAYRRGFGMMFQDYALFPHLDVFENLVFGLREQGMKGQALHSRAGELLAIVGLSGYERRRVHELSGGERQRVALARALAPRPTLLMLDEPLAALDRELRERLQEELRAILHELGLTAIYVTHDQEEAFALADRIALLHAGRLVQYAPPEQLYRVPVNAWAARFLGLDNLVEGLYRGAGIVDTPLGRLHGLGDDQAWQIGRPLLVALYPDAARPAAEEPRAGDLLIEGLIEESRFRGRRQRVVLRHRTGLRLGFEFDRPPGPVGALIRLQVAAGGCTLLPAEE